MQYRSKKKISFLCTFKLPWLRSHCSALWGRAGVWTNVRPPPPTEGAPGLEGGYKPLSTPPHHWVCPWRRRRIQTTVDIPEYVPYLEDGVQTTFHLPRPPESAPVPEGGVYKPLLTPAPPLGGPWPRGRGTNHCLAWGHKSWKSCHGDLNIRGLSTWSL